MRDSIAQVSEETLKVEVYIRTRKPGDVVLYSEVHKGTGVPMDERGKDRLRTALKRVGLSYTTIPGQGVQLASHETAVPVFSVPVRRVGSAMKRACKVGQNLLGQFAAEMDPADRDAIHNATSTMEVIRVQAEASSRNLARLGRGRVQLAAPPEMQAIPIRKGG